MAESPTPDGEGITITRVFDAPRERVWREWTEQQRFADWFGGEEAEVPVSTVTMDVNEGGAWQATMFAGPERREIHWHGEYREAIAPERLVLTLSDQPGDDLYELVIVVLTDLGDGRTEMLFQQRGRMSAKQYEAAGDGWSTFFDRMAEHLSGH
ncbi:MAG: SRPBCC domain-containing protein [Thermoleophilaceae bacterium]|nr:SRPBCC domain-containing protein [Thermoleophilaceae bacterium]